MMGESESVGMSDSVAAEDGTPLPESRKNKKPLLTEGNKILSEYLGRYSENYTNEITERDRKREAVFERVDVLGKNLFINESLDRTISELDLYLNNTDNNENE